MKSAFSTAWKASTQPRKQRKYRFNLPMHAVNKLLAVHLSKELRTKYGLRAVRARVGDKVRILRGTHKGKEGKVERVDTRNAKLSVAKVERIKRDGSKAVYPLEPSNLMIIELAGDKRRFKRVGAGANNSAPKKAPKKEEKKTD